MEFAEFLVILLGLSNGLIVDSYGGVHLDGTESGQCIGCCIVCTLDMSNVGSELRNIIKVANLLWGVLLWPGHESIGKGLVVSENVKGTAFQEVLEVFDGQIDRKELPVKSTGPRLSWFKLLR